MNKVTISKQYLMMALLLMAASPVLAEMDHSAMGHEMSGTSSTKMKTKLPLQKLAAIPASGKAREGGYDGLYLMESTDAVIALSTRCAQASRGLVMMDNTDWSRCGGKPDGAAGGEKIAKVSQPESRMDGHAGHNM